MRNVRSAITGMTFNLVVSSRDLADRLEFMA